MIKRFFMVLTSCVLSVSVLACGADNTSNPGNDVAEVVEPSTDVRLNEIDCHGTDWIELVNVGDMVVDISGWIVTDSLEKTDHFYTFPEGSIVRAANYLVVKTIDTDRDGFDFGIKCDGESIYLLDPDKKVVDVTDVTAVPDGFTWGRSPDGTGTFQLTLPTQGTSNIVTPDTPEKLYDPTVVNTFEITLGTDAMTSLTVDPYEYVDGVLSVTVDGDVVAGQPVGVRLKSGYSFQPLTGKASFKIRAEGYAVGDRILGMKNFTLNNMVDDPTMMHETLAYALFRAAGVPAPRTGYARVRVNGQEYGLYVLIENYDDQFTTFNFQSTGHLYEGTGDLYAGQIGGFEIEDGDKYDTSDLETLMARVAASPETNWFADVGDVADLYEMTLMWAIEIFIGQSDGYALAANNYFLHADDDGIFTMMPWGVDRAFTDTPDLYSCSSVMCVNCLANALCRTAYEESLKSIPGLVTQAGLIDMIDSVGAAILSVVESDPRKPYTTAEHQTAVDALKIYIPARAAAVAE